MTGAAKPLDLDAIRTHAELQQPFGSMTLIPETVITLLDRVERLESAHREACKCGMFSLIADKCWFGRIPID